MRNCEPKTKPQVCRLGFGFTMTDKRCAERCRSCFCCCAWLSHERKRKATTLFVWLWRSCFEAKTKTAHLWLHFDCRLLFKARAVVAHGLLSPLSFCLKSLTVLLSIYCSVACGNTCYRSNSSSSNSRSSSSRIPEWYCIA